MWETGASRLIGCSGSDSDCLPFLASAVGQDLQEGLACHCGCGAGPWHVVVVERLLVQVFEEALASELLHVGVQVGQPISPGWRRYLGDRWVDAGVLPRNACQVMDEAVVVGHLRVVHLRSHLPYVVGKAEGGVFFATLP